MQSQSENVPEKMASKSTIKYQINDKTSYQLTVSIKHLVLDIAVNKLCDLTSFLEQLKTPAENRCTASQETQAVQEFPPCRVLSVALLPP